jgi:hypothetical protein
VVGDNKESLKGKGVFFGSSVGGWWFVGVWVWVGFGLAGFGVGLKRAFFAS